MNEFPMLLAVAESFLEPVGPVAEAQRSHLINVLLLTLIAIVPAAVAVPLILWRYRRSNPKAQYRPDWDSNLKLEALMWGVPGLVVVLMGVSLWNITMRLDPYKELGKDPLEVQVVGLDWKWVFIYPEQDVALVDELIVPEGRAVRLRLTTDTVMQSLRISAIVGQIYAMPGMVTDLNFIAAEEGESRGMNTQFTGLGFWEQKFIVRSVSPEAFEKRMAAIRQSSLKLNAQTYAILAEQGSSEEAKKPLGIPDQEGPIEMVLADPKIFERVVARYHTGEPLTAETQPGSPGYQPEKALLPPAPAQPMSMNKQDG